MGESGSGKSTVIQLLLRLYDPSAGAVLLDGRDVRSMPLEHLRSQVRTAAVLMCMLGGAEYLGKCRLPCFHCWSQSCCFKLLAKRELPTGTARPPTFPPALPAPRADWPGQPDPHPLCLLHL